MGRVLGNKSCIMAIKKGYRYRRDNFVEIWGVSLLGEKEQSFVLILSENIAKK